MSIAHIMIRNCSPDQQRRVSTSLNALSGVEHAQVDHGHNIIRVSYDDDVTTLRQLRKTVQAGGIDVLSEWKEPF